jgi:hypothetical protein
VLKQPEEVVESVILQVEEQTEHELVEEHRDK